MKKWLALIVVVVILVAGYALYYHHKGAVPPSAGKEVKICAILPLTGFVSSFGEQMKQGQELAQELINSGYFGTPKLKISIVFADSKADPKEAVSVYRKARMEGIKYFTTTRSPVALSLIPLVKQDGVLLFADTTHPAISNSGELIFRHAPTASQEAEIINEYIRSAKLDKIALISINDDYGKAFQDKLQELLRKSGKSITMSILHSKEESDFRSIVLKLINSKPEAVVIGSVGASPGLIVSRLREYKFGGDIIAGTGFGFPESLKAAGANAKGVHYIVQHFNRNDPSYKKLNEEFRRRYHSDMSDFSLLEFNTIKLLADALNTVGDDIEKVAQYIRSLGEYKGVGERMHILPSGDVLPELKIITP